MRVHDSGDSPDFINYSAVAYDLEGFWSREHDHPKVLWSSIIRISDVDCLEIAIDFEAIAFQTENPSICPFLIPNPSSQYAEFIRELHSRFELAQPPPRIEWSDPLHTPKSYIMWPREEIGNPLFVAVRKKWYHLHPTLMFARVDERGPCSGPNR